MILPLLMAVCANAQLSGVYTISNNPDDNADYASFSAAASALSAGISGEVVFEVAPGTYEEYLTLNAITGAAADSRVVFRGMGADNQQVVLTSNAGYTNNSTVTNNGADFVTFENMTFTTTSSNNAVLFRFEGDVDNNRFESVRFVGVEVTGSGYSSTDNDKNLVRMKSGDGLICDGNEFIGCQFINGHIALYLTGHNMTQFYNDMTIKDCYFSNQKSKGIYITHCNNVIIQGNTINNSNDSYNNYNAIDLFQCFKSNRIENNVINVQRNEHYTIAMQLRPCVGDSLDHTVVANNIVNLNSNASSYSYCFSISHNNSAYIDVAHNTFRCTGTGNNGNIYLENNGKNISFHNNLLVNESTGYVFRFITATLENRFSDYNRVSFSGNNFARRGTVDYPTIQAWTDSTGLDENTELCSVAFVNDNDLHITGSGGLTVVNPLAYVTTDIDGEERSETPCAGADELVEGQNLPPVVANPIADITFETYPASQEIDITGVFEDPDDDNESIEVEIASNSNPDLVSAELTENIITVERLLTTGGNATITLLAISDGDSVQTSFTVTCIAQDLPPVVAEAIEEIVFTTFPQTLTFDLSDVFDDPDNNNLFMEYDVESLNEEVTAYIDDDDFLVVIRKSADAVIDTLVVSATSNGKTVEMTVPVSGDAVVIEVGVADFEDVELSANGYWQPAAEGYSNIVSNGWMFTNYYSSYFWGGYTVSNITDTTTSGMAAQYTAVAGAGVDGSSQYAVVYAMGSPTTISAADGQARTITGCYITNNLWAYKTVRYGDAYSSAFGGADGTSPDYFVLHATGKDADGNTTGTADFYLADFRFNDSDSDYIVDTWKWFDLSGLGEVATVSFNLESTDVNSWGMVTPAYFCMDNFNGVAPEEPVVVEIGIADFEDVEMNAGDHWVSAAEGTSAMVNNGWAFTNHNFSTYWGGITASNATDTTLSGYSAQYVAVPGSGLDGSEKYGVAYVMGYGYDTEVATADGSSHTVTGFYVTNNVYAYKSMRDGDAYSAAFGGADGTEPDFLVLHATGKDADGNTTGTADFYLADYRFNDSDSDYIVDTWKWFDLSALGEVVSVSFTMESSQNGEWGMNTPAYFCIDNFNGVAPEEPVEPDDQAPYVVNPVADMVSEHFPETLTADLNGVATDDDSPVDEITYSLIANSNEAAAIATVEDNVLQVVRQNANPATATLTLRANSGDLYVDFTVNVELKDATGIADRSNIVKLYPNPASDVLNISVRNSVGFNYNIYNSVGQTVLSGKSAVESVSVNISDFSRGFYYVEIVGDGCNFKSKIVVK